MIFTSVDFLVFFAAVFCLYWALPWRRAQNALLLAANYFFCGYVHPWFCIPLAATTALDYLCGLGMRRRPAARRALLVVSVAGHLAALGVFKYFNFFAESIGALLAAAGLDPAGPVLDVLLPAGLSFYTFQAMTYTIEVCRGRMEPRTDLLDFAVFVSMFPQMMSGPIERAANLMPQIEAPRSWRSDLLPAAVSLLAWGYFKKLVIADNLGIYVDRIFMLELPAPPLLGVGALAFAVQLYADFSAYTDIARGIARLLGFRLSLNFDAPYLAVSPSDFWRRWHISLSSWIRDYLYIPLGGSRGTAWRNARSLLIAMGLCGLWHGAGWNFVVWGLYHGLVLLAYRALGLAGRWRPESRWSAAAARLVMFLLACVGWAIFRAPSLGWLGRALAGGVRAGASAEEWIVAVTLAGYVLAFALPMMLMQFCERRFRGAPWLRALLYGAALAGVAVLARDARQDFIYFGF